MIPEAWMVAVPVGLAASAEDVFRGRISNWIPATAFAGGLFCQVREKSWSGAGAALLGAGLGFGVFLILYLMGKMGGGDVKLMAGFGALLGAGLVVTAAVWTALVGALWAGVTLVICALAGRRAKTIPYAPSIAIGTWLALLARTG